MVLEAGGSLPLSPDTLTSDLVPRITTIVAAEEWASDKELPEFLGAEARQSDLVGLTFPVISSRCLAFRNRSGVRRFFYAVDSGGMYIRPRSAEVYSCQG